MDYDSGASYANMGYHFAQQEPGWLYLEYGCSGGFGGSLGLFANHKIGKHTSYITHNKQGVLTLTTRGAVAFSCENCEELIEGILNKSL